MNSIKFIQQQDSSRIQDIESIRMHRTNMLDPEGDHGMNNSQNANKTDVYAILLRLVYISFSVFLRRLHEYHSIFAERLNCRHVFVNCLEKEGIITEEERRNIMEADGDVATRTYEGIPESCWPQRRDSEQMLMSNKKLLRCLPEKNYSQISKFLELMEDICLTHILNYFVNDKGIAIFQICRLMSL